MRAGCTRPKSSSAARDLVRASAPRASAGRRWSIRKCWCKARSAFDGGGALASARERSAVLAGRRVPIDVRRDDGRWGNDDLGAATADPGIAQRPICRSYSSGSIGAGIAGKQRAVGTGMGLSIARGLIAAEHGRIPAENRPGGGAQFTIGVPAESRAATAETVANHDARASASCSWTMKCRFSVTLAPLLRSRGYTVDVAGLGRRRARSDDRTTRPISSCSISGLPDLEGTEVCRRIRSDVRGAHHCAVRARRRDRQSRPRSILAPTAHVTKPFGPEELLARIRVALRRVFSAEDARNRAGAARAESDDRLRSPPCRAQRRGNPAHAQGVRARLAASARNADRVITHRAILKAVWGPHAVDQPGAPVGARRDSSARRSKPRSHPSRDILVSEPWVGYRFGSDPPKTIFSPY